MRYPFKNAVLYGLFASFGTFLNAQTTIRLKNPSFEWDEPQAGKTPQAWENAGSSQESPPDIQPGAFLVNQKAAEGKRFLGMVTRDNNTWEGVSQELNGWLEKDSTYVFRIFLARSNRYVSLSKMTNTEQNYTQPTVLKIWGYNKKTGKEELLAQSTPVEHSDWQEYAFLFQPKLDAYNQIDLMVYYAKGYEEKNGNLLLDACSDIVKIKNE